MLYKLIKVNKKFGNISLKRSWKINHLVTLSQVPCSKDINSKIALFKINALRLLPIVIDPSNSYINWALSLQC